MHPTLLLFVARSVFKFVTERRAKPRKKFILLESNYSQLDGFQMTRELSTLAPLQYTTAYSIIDSEHHKTLFSKLKMFFMYLNAFKSVFKCIDYFASI